MKLKHRISYFTEYQEFLFYIIIGIISFIGDIYSGKNKLYNSCKQPSYTLTILFLHHLYASFIYFGWLSNHKNILILHLISIAIAIMLQLNNEMRCPSTDIVNNNCNITRVNYLRDFLYFTNIKKENLYYVYVFFSFMISCIKIYNFKK
jgi:hypothetical protein